MKHILKYTTLCCSCLAYGSVVGYGDDKPNTFPVTKTLEKAPSGYIENLHKFLCKKVLQGHVKNNDAATFVMHMGLRNANRFACAFVAKTNQNRTLTVYINDIPPQKFKRTHEEINAFVEHFDTKKYEYAKNATESTDVKEKIFSEGSFRSTHLLPLYWTIFADRFMRCSLLEALVECGFCKKDDFSKMFFHLVALFDFPPSDYTWRRCYNGDSEFHALYTLERMANMIASRFKELLSLGERIASMEFHGCTTRDMCASCYAHMNAMQALINKRSRRGVLGRLKDACWNEKIAEKNWRCATFISSIKEFPTKIEVLYPSKNHLMSDPAQDATISNGYVHQFRFPYQDVLNIQKTDENTLRSAANVHDLKTANGFPLFGSVSDLFLGYAGTPFHRIQEDTDTVKSSDNNDPSKSLNQDPFNGTDRFPASKAQADTDTDKSLDNNNSSESSNQDPFNGIDRFSVSKAQINTDIVKSPDYNDFSQSLKK